MPQVPIYNGTQVRRSGLQPVFQNTPDVSSGLQNVARAIGTVGEVYDRRLQRDAETEANRIDTEVTAGWLQWDAENRRKYQGQNVDEYQAKAQEWWAKAQEAHAGASPEVAQRIGSALGRKRTQALGSVYAHVNGEKERTADTMYDNAQKADAQYAVTTGDTVGMAANIRDRAAVYAARKGLGTDDLEVEVTQRLATMHLSVIEALAASNPQKAQAYYNEAKKRNEIPATAQARVEQVLQGEAENQQAKTLAAKNSGKPLEEQLAAGADLPPKAQEKYLIEVRNRHATVTAARLERENAAKDEAWNYIRKGRQVPEEVYVRMGGENAGRLQDILAARAKQAAAGAGGTKIKTNWDAYERVSAAIAAGQNVRVAEFEHLIAPSEMEKLVDLKNKRANPAKAPEVASAEQQMNAFTSSLNIKHEDQGKFRAAAYDEFNAFLREKKREPNFEERAAIMAELNKEIVTNPGWLWDTKDPAYKADPAARRKALAPPPAPVPKGSPTASMIGIMAPAADAYVKGKVYVDAKGNRATYQGGGKWAPAP
jgi:hypothetical protein